MFAKFPIYYAAFAAGAAGMALEIIGLGILAPYFGTALLVHTNVIGVVLISLAIGYRVGGIRADRGVNLQSLYRLFFLSAGWVGIVFSLRNVIGSFIGWAIPVVSVGSFVMATILFSVPCVLLGMVLPYVIKIHATRDGQQGKMSGMLYGVSAIGSIFGTFSVGLVMLPHTYYEGSLLFIMALLFFGAYVCNQVKGKMVMLAVIVSGILVTQVPLPEFVFHKFPIFSDGKIKSDTTQWEKLADKTGVFSRVQVYEGTEFDSKKPLRFMLVNGEVHSATYLDSNDLVFGYAQYNRLGGHFNPAAKKALLIGGGSYSYAKYFLTDTPLYDVEKVWELGGKQYHNSKTVSLPVLFTNDLQKQKQERKILYTSTSTPVGRQIEGVYNHIDVDNQPPRRTVRINEADIVDTGFDTAAGYVHIHEVKDDGTPGRVISGDLPIAGDIQRSRSIIGKGELISGENKNVDVQLDRPTKEGEVLYAMLHRDNGNGHFDDFLVDGYEQIEALDVVEIDPRTTELAEKYFHLNRTDPRLRIFHEDGRTFLNRSEDTYDIIYLDAFRSFYGVPWQLTTIEATRKVFGMLNDNGVVVANVPASLSGEFSGFFQAELKTYQAVFPEVRVYGVLSPLDEQQVQNIIMVAFKSKETIRDFPNDDTDINIQLTHEWFGTSSPHTKILTDDFAPTDYYTSKFADLHIF